MEINIFPKGYRVLVSPDPIEDTYGDAKIVVVEDKRAVKASAIKGTVIGIGELAFKGFKEDSTPWCVVGDRVLYSQYAGKFLTDPITDAEYIILNDEDIIATIREKS